MGEWTIYSAALTLGGLTCVSVFHALQPDAAPQECVQICRSFLQAIGEDSHALQNPVTEIVGDHCLVTINSQPGSNVSFTVDRHLRKVVRASLAGLYENQGRTLGFQSLPSKDLGNYADSLKRKLKLPSNLAAGELTISSDGVYGHASYPLIISGYPFVDSFYGVMFSVNLKRGRLASFQSRFDHPAVRQGAVRIDKEGAIRAARISFDDVDAELGWANSGRESFARLCWRLSSKDRRMNAAVFVDAEDGRLVKTLVTRVN